MKQNLQLEIAYTIPGFQINTVFAIHITLYILFCT